MSHYVSQHTTLIVNVIFLGFDYTTTFTEEKMTRVFNTVKVRIFDHFLKFKAPLILWIFFPVQSLQTSPFTDVENISNDASL